MFQTMEQVFTDATQGTLQRFPALTQELRHCPRQVLVNHQWLPSDFLESLQVLWRSAKHAAKGVCQALASLLRDSGRCNLVFLMLELPWKRKLT